MTDELMLGGLDQNLPTEDGWLMRKVDEIVEESIEKKDVYIALNSCRQLIQISQLSGKALAKFFYLIRENWEIYEIGDDFFDVIHDYLGRHPATVQKYIRVWEMHEYNLIPEKFAEDIRERNIKDQVPIANALAQGYEIENDEWQKLVDAPDFTSVSAEIREIKGKEPRKSALLTFMGRDGTLSATQEGLTEFVGYLNIDDAGEIAKKAIERIIRSAGIMER